MNGLGKLVVAGLAAVTLSACGTQLEKAEAVSPEGSAFDVALYQGYLGLAKSETGEGDYRDSDSFALRAISAGAGGKIEPEAIAARRLPQDKVGELSGARERLVAALGAGAAQKMPAESADAQVKFDCWMQEQEENFQPDHIAACRDGFYTAVAALEKKPVAAVEPKPAPLRYVIYFDFDSADVDEKAKEVIFEAEAAARRLKGSRISVSGYTDTVGTDTYNKVLSELRAGAVAKLMQSQGYPAERVSAEGFGKTNLAVPTADGVKEPGNRRAVIFVQPE